MLLPPLASMRGFRPSQTLATKQRVLIRLALGSAMRTYEMHFSPKEVKRSSGRSSVAASAYRSASRLVDERTGLVHDYTRKQGVEHTRLYLPDNAPQWAHDRQQLWNAAERKENRSNSMTAREFEIAFPAEFNTMQRREAGDAIAREIVRRFGCAVDIAYHKPSAGGDERNYHAHIMYTGRAFDPTTKDGWAKNRYRDMNKDKIRDPETNEPTTKISLTMRQMRAFTAQEMNRIAERDRLPVRTEHLSFEARGIDREPTNHLGTHATQMERRGEPSRIGNDNRAIRDRNASRVENERDLASTNAGIALHRDDFDIWKHEKRQELRHSHELAQIDLARGQDRQKRRHESELKQTYGAERERVKVQLATVNERLRTSGFRRIFRNILGRTSTDQEIRSALIATLRNNKRREEEQRQIFARAQLQARERLKTKQQNDRDTLETNLARGRTLDSYGHQKDRMTNYRRGRDLRRSGQRTLGRQRTSPPEQSPQPDKTPQSAVRPEPPSNPTPSPQSIQRRNLEQGASDFAGSFKKARTVEQQEQIPPSRSEPTPALDLEPSFARKRAKPRPTPAPKNEPDLATRKTHTERRIDAAWRESSLGSERSTERPSWRSDPFTRDNNDRGRESGGRHRRPSPDGDKD